MKNTKIIIIGAGIGGLATAALLGKKGCKVTLLEKNTSIGGRAGQFADHGFTFDMGASWYMMPEVFERFFGYFGKKPSDYYYLKKLDPKYRVFFGKNDTVDIVDDNKQNFKVFESIERGSTPNIKSYLEKSKHIYGIAMKHFIYKNYDSLFDICNFQALRAAITLPLFTNMQHYISKFTQNKRLQKLLLYTTLFIGNSPKHTPALYSLMSHLDFTLGVYYPTGGMYQVVKALESLCREYGVKIITKAPVQKIVTKRGCARSVLANNKRYIADYIISNANYAHTELRLLGENQRSYGREYWEQKTRAPSAFVLYLGVKGKIKNLKHHSMIFTHDWHDHFDKMYDKATWPDKPSIYICTPSKSDPRVAPKGCESMRVFVPITTGVKDTPEKRLAYKEKILDIIEDITGEEIRSRIQVERIFGIRDYKKLYNSYRGAAFGLTPTKFYRALFRPSNKSKKIRNLFYAGQDTLPGVGMPTALISSELAVARVMEAEASS